MAIKIITYISIVLLLFGCQEPKEEVLDLKDVLPSSDRDYSKTDEEVEMNDDDVLLAWFNASGFEFISVQPMTKRLFPDRFGPDTSYMYELISEEDTIDYHKWVFKDSAKVINSFFNWIDCFGDNCKSLYVGEERNFQKNGFHLLVGDSTLVFIEGNGLSFNNWYEFHESIGYKSDWNYSIEQRYRGRARWYTFEDKKKKRFEPK